MARGARDYKAEYARRIASAEKRGLSRQRARGHVEREHVFRKEREIAEHGLTLSQIRTVERWSADRASQIKDASIDPEETVVEAIANGYDWFKNYRKTWDAARRMYKREIANGSWESKGMGYLEMLTSLASAPDISWLYYH